jgi:hypothetical protein
MSQLTPKIGIIGQAKWLPALEKLRQEDHRVRLAKVHSETPISKKRG